MSDIDDSPIESFSLRIPIQEILLHEKYNKNGIRVSEDLEPWIYISSKIISSKCDKTHPQAQEISISQVDLTPKKAYHFDGREMKKYQVLNDKKYTIYYVHEYYEDFELVLAESIKVFLVSKDLDIKGRKAYFIYLEDTWIDRDISIHEYAIAFVKDALFYPIAIFMMGGWGH